MSSIAGIIFSKYEWKIVDIFLGDDTGIMKYQDFDITKNAFVRGKVLEKIEDMIVLEAIVGKDSEKREVMINSGWIKAIMQVNSFTDKTPITNILLSG